MSSTLTPSTDCCLVGIIDLFLPRRQSPCTAIRMSSSTRNLDINRTTTTTMPPPPPPPTLFSTNPLLSYPLFETYRLSSHPAQSDVHTLPLPTSHYVARSESGATGYKETKKRVEWNYLHNGIHMDEVLW